jgi:protein-S-isoprenylcysteine O-methyltransferase Ste14
MDAAMSPWLPRAVVLVGILAMFLVPALVHRGASIPVARAQKGRRERVLLALVALGFLLTITWITTPLLAFADYGPRPVVFATGSLLFAVGLWLLYRTHAALGAYWSVTLEVREGHRLVTQGLYRTVRHPMYLALLTCGAGQALALPNFVAGPAPFVAFALLFAMRLGPEERLMRETFGAEYEAYRARTARLLPGVW